MARKKTWQAVAEAAIGSTVRPRTRTRQPELKPCPTSQMRLVARDDDPLAMPSLIEFTPATGGRFVGTVEEINGLLAAMGYHAVEIRRNLMSRVLYLEAKDTPVFMSPASETYWSM